MFISIQGLLYPALVVGIRGLLVVFVVVAAVESRSGTLDLRGQRLVDDVNRVV